MKVKQSKKSRTIFKNKKDGRIIIKEILKSGFDDIKIKIGQNNFKFIKI